MTDERTIACPLCGKPRTFDEVRRMLSRKRPIVLTPCCRQKRTKAEVLEMRDLLLGPVAQCPRCEADYTFDAVRSLWGRVNRQRQLLEDDPRLKAPCCGRKLTVDHIKTMWGRATAALRVKHGAGTGRPREPDRCPCGMFTKERAAKRRHICQPPPGG